MATERARLFFALWPPAGLAEELAGLARQVAAASGGKPTRGDTVHLTLAFLGEVPLERLDELQAAAASVQAPAFALRVDRLGYWRHNRLCWAGCAPAPALQTLVDGLHGALAAAGFAVDGEAQAFVPHLTLVRKLAAAPAMPDLPAFRPWPCARFVLVRSRLSAAGSAYETLGEFALGR